MHQNGHKALFVTAKKKKEEINSMSNDKSMVK